MDGNTSPYIRRLEKTVEDLVHERAGLRAEVERLTRERDAIIKAVIVDGWDYDGEPEDNRSFHYWTIGNPTGEDEWYGSEAQAIEGLRKLAGLDVTPTDGPA